MNYSIHVPPSLSRFIDCLRGDGPRHLFSAAGAALHNLIQRHLLAIAPTRHASAQKLGAVPTDHFGKGIGGMSWTSDENSATVTIPIPGLNRAFGPLHIVARRARALTIPIHAFSYGHRAYEMSAKFGYKLFRPRGKDILFGQIDNNAPIPLYALKKAVTLRQDRSLLPSDAEINNTVAQAMFDEINRISKL